MRQKKATKLCISVSWAQHIWKTPDFFLSYLDVLVESYAAVKSVPEVRWKKP